MTVINYNFQQLSHHPRPPPSLPPPPPTNPHPSPSFCTASKFVPNNKLADDTKGEGGWGTGEKRRSGIAHHLEAGVRPRSSWFYQFPPVLTVNRLSRLLLLLEKAGFCSSTFTPFPSPRVLHIDLYRSASSPTYSTRQACLNYTIKQAFSIYAPGIPQSKLPKCHEASLYSIDQKYSFPSVVKQVFLICIYEYHIQYCTRSKPVPSTFTRTP